MSRNQKEKLETYTDITLQLEPEISTESAVTAADGCNLESSPKKRKKEAEKPIYLRRV